MNIIKSMMLASSVAFLFGEGSWSPASAANVGGNGSIDTDLPPPLESVSTDYEAPDFLDVAKTVQLNGSEAGGSIPVGSKALSYFGDAQFGRLGARSFIGGQVPSSPDLSTSVHVGMGFFDQIAFQNLNPLRGNNLRLDIALSGEMTGYGATNFGATIGKVTNASFGIVVKNFDSTVVVAFSSVEFRWFGETLIVTSEPDFVPYPGEEPRFTQNPTPGPPRRFFDARGYIDIPLDTESLLFGGHLELEVGVNASSSCGNEIPECLAISDFDAARIENARLVDENGDPILGATFSSTSGYDYITAPVPEPEAFALMGTAIATLASLRRRSELILRTTPG
jgi:hypothetical protein